MRYESTKTEKGNIGVSYVSQEKADEQAQIMDFNDCKYCTGCTDCTDCKYFVEGKPTPPEKAAENLEEMGLPPIVETA